MVFESVLSSNNACLMLDGGTTQGNTGRCVLALSCCLRRHALMEPTGCVRKLNGIAARLLTGFCSVTPNPQASPHTIPNT